MAPDRDALITGIGLVSCLGEALEAHWAALNASGGFQPVVDTDAFRAVGRCIRWRRWTWTSRSPSAATSGRWRPGSASACTPPAWRWTPPGSRATPSCCQRMDMIVAAGGGERDYAVDAAILSALPNAAEPGRLLNEHLLADLRPTLFLAQLSNLLAGNISIVHGVVGSSRTFMGEEAGGADAVRIACARIAAGQGDLFLVGGSFNAERPDVLLHYEMGGVLRRPPARIAGASGQRQAAGGGMVLGSVGCFLVIESRAHAAARGATPIARIAGDRHRPLPPPPGEATANAAGATRRRCSPSATRRRRGDLRRLRRRRADRRGGGVPAPRSACRCAPPPPRSAIRWKPPSPPAWRWRRCRCRKGRCSRRWKPPRRR